MASRTASAALAVLVASAGASFDPGCLGILSARGWGRGASRARRDDALLPRCAAGAGGRSLELCFLACGLCTAPELSVSVDDAFYDAYCTGGAPLPGDGAILGAAVNTLLNASAMQGMYFIEANVSDAYTLLLQGMPRRDMLVLFAEPYMLLDFLGQTVRMALNQWGWAESMGVPWEVFFPNVLPYAFVDETRDFYWRWRPRFYQLLMPLLTAANVSTITQAMHVIADAIPQASTLGMLSLVNPSAPQGAQLEPGQPITWRSETSPGYISPSEVAYRGGSCTGTAIVLAAAARSVGIPARLAGCTESIVRFDDHHWVEFYDPTAPGFASDFWHTKEGTATGNTGGPWDAPSGPMLGCLAGVIPGSTIDTLWASDWASPTYLPMLWSNDTWSAAWAFAGGVNRCGAYCGVWGCGVNNTEKWTQAQCGPQQGASG